MHTRKQMKADCAYLHFRCAVSLMVPSSITVAQLIEMGFSRGMATAALELAGGDLQQSIGLLLEGQVSEPQNGLTSIWDLD